MFISLTCMGHQCDTQPSAVRCLLPLQPLPGPAAQGLPLQCSVFVTRRAGLLESTNSSNADYLFQPDKLHADMVPPRFAS